MFITEDCYKTATNMALKYFSKELENNFIIFIFEKKGVNYNKIKPLINNDKLISLNIKSWKNRTENCDKILDILIKNNIDYLLLCSGKLLSGVLLEKYNNRIINIHTALLPSFKGRYSYEKALNRGVKFIGCTVHFIDKDIDEGIYITQSFLPVSYITKSVNSYSEINEKLQKDIWFMLSISLIITVKLLLKYDYKINENILSFPEECYENNIVMNPCTSKEDYKYVEDFCRKNLEYK